MIATSQPVFVALSDPIRRSLLIGLAENGPSTATEFARQYPMSRQGILKHLSVLDNAGLVKVSKTGRDQRYELAPAPLADVDDFVRSVEAKLDARLSRLKALVESENDRSSL